MAEVKRVLGCLAFGAVAGLALAAVVAAVVLAFPETLLDFGDGVYDADGQYQGMRQ